MMAPTPPLCKWQIFIVEHGRLSIWHLSFTVHQYQWPLLGLVGSKALTSLGSCPALSGPENV